jgi:hypothetical protein
MPNPTSSKGSKQSLALEPFLLSRKAAALSLSISTRSLDHLIANGRLSTRKIGGRVLILVEELRRFVARDRRELLVPVPSMKVAA